MNEIPAGYRSVTPYLKVFQAGRLVEFLRQAFGGFERAKLLKPDGSLLHAEVMIGDSLIMVHEAPPHWTAKPATLYLYVPDVEATYQQALAAGGVSIQPPTNMYYGDRVAVVRDLAENDWWMATRMETTSLEEMQQRAANYLQNKAR